MAFVPMKKSYKESVEKVSLLSKENKINRRLYTAKTALNFKKPTKTNKKGQKSNPPQNTKENNINASLMLSV